MSIVGREGREGVICIKRKADIAACVKTNGGCVVTSQMSHVRLTARFMEIASVQRLCTVKETFLQTSSRLFDSSSLSL